MRPILSRLLIGAAGAALLATMYLTFVWVPMEATMGPVQRIFYIHVPSAFAAFLAYVIGGVAAVAFLANRKNSLDDLSVACNEVGLVFNTANIVTGMLWAKPIWGVYWAWDARLTGMLLLALIYVAYLILRQSISDPGQRAVVCAVVSIFGTIDIPIVYMATRWWRTQHPGPVIGGDGSLDPRMTFVLFFAGISFGLLLWCLVRHRRHLEALRRRADALKRQVHALA